MKGELRWLLLLVVLGILLVNTTGLGRQNPSSAAAVLLRDGHLLKSGDAIFLIENGQKRHIINLDAFTHKGFDWGGVRLVDESLINALPEGPPVAVLLKGSGPDIFLLDGNTKRHITTLEAFEASNFTWDDVRYVSEAELDQYPDGLPIPPLTPVPPSASN